MNRPDVFRIVAGLERRGYLIKETHIEGEDGLNLQDRYDALMKYLDI